MKRQLLVLLILFIANNTLFAIDYSIPNDLPTIECLIELHKQMKKYESLSLTQVATVTAEQEVTTDLATKISDIKTTINKKMSDAHSYLIFATTISGVALKLKDLTLEYEDFITEVGPMVIKKPYTANYYANAQAKIINEVKRLEKSIAGFSVAGINVLKASMDEKFKLLYIIDSSINRMRNAIRHATSYIRYVQNGNIKILNPSNLIPDELRNSVSEKLIDQWNKTLPL